MKNIVEHIRFLKLQPDLNLSRYGPKIESGISFTRTILRH